MYIWKAPLLTKRSFLFLENTNASCSEYGHCYMKHWFLGLVIHIHLTTTYSKNPLHEGIFL